MHEYIVYIADRTAQREVEALADYHGAGVLVQSGELSYDDAKAQLVEAFEARGLAKSTAVTYLSQANVIASVLPTFAEVETFADEFCDGSRSLKRIHTAIVRQSNGLDPEPNDDDDAAGDADDAEMVKADVLDVVLAALPNLNADDLEIVVKAARELISR